MLADEMDVCSKCGLRGDLEGHEIVANLKEQGMLKDEVVNALLSPPRKK